MVEIEKSQIECAEGTIKDIRDFIELAKVQKKISSKANQETISKAIISTQKVITDKVEIFTASGEDK